MKTYDQHDQAGELLGLLESKGFTVIAIDAARIVIYPASKAGDELLSSLVHLRFEVRTILEGRRKFAELQGRLITLKKPHD